MYVPSVTRVQILKELQWFAYQALPLSISKFENFKFLVIMGCELIISQLGYLLLYLQILQYELTYLVEIFLNFI